jgi:pSer/pThr/pTyr-binding forkhead associated (FHA) protein
MPMTQAGCPVHSLGETVARANRGPAPRSTTRDGEAPDAATTVDFPWGPVAVGAAQVWIGRSPDCGELAGRLEGYENVSRRHAVLWREGTVLYLRDQDSTNGTFINDRPIPPREKTRVHEGDVLRFGGRLRATVRRIHEPT